MSVRLYDTRIAGRLRINGRSNGNTRYVRLNVRRELGVEVNELRLNLFVKTIQAERQRPLLITEDGIRLDDMDKTACRDKILDPFLEIRDADRFRPAGQRLEERLVFVGRCRAQLLERTLENFLLHVDGRIRLLNRNRESLKERLIQEVRADKAAVIRPTSFGVRRREDGEAGTRRNRDTEFLDGQRTTL